MTRLLPAPTGPLAASLLLAALVTAGCGDSAGRDDLDPSSADGIADAAADATPDASGGGDASETYVPPLEQISKVSFKIGGVSNTFDLNARADYISAEEQLKISATKGLRKLEINVMPVPPFAVGHWADSIFSEVSVLICYTDGTTPGELSSCGVGFTHEAIGYDVTLTANGGVDHFVEGTFSATLEDAAGQTLELSDGVFAVKHR